MLRDTAIDLRWGVTCTGEGVGAGGGQGKEKELWEINNSHYVSVNASRRVS